MTEEEKGKGKEDETQKYWHSGVMVRVPRVLLDKILEKHPEWRRLSTVDVIRIILENEAKKK